MKKKYLIKIAYRNGSVAQSDKSYQCKVTVGRPGYMDYAFICMPVKTWERREMNSPVLEIQELKDNQGNLAFLQVGILRWQGSVPGVVSVNDHVIFPAHELKAGSIKNSVGMTKKVPVELFEEQLPLSLLFLDLSAR